MAQGDILTVRIADNGYYAEVDIENMGLSGSCNTGFPNYTDTLFTGSTPTFRIDLVSKGFTDNGGFTYISRSLVGTKYVRCPFPRELIPDQLITGTTTTVKVYLSDFYYSEDTGSVTIDAGFYTSASISSSVLTNYSLQNSSSHIYPKVIGNWYWPCWDIITGSYYKLRMGAFHRSAEQGRPVRAVKFTARDNVGNSGSTFVLNPIIDTNVPDANPVIEYIWEMPSSTFSQSAVVTCSFAAYPWYGNSSSILDTSLSQHTHSRQGNPTPYYTDIYLLNDKDHTYGETICVVNPYTGNDTTGIPIDSSSFVIGSPPAAFATIGKAASSASVYNNIRRGRNDVGNAKIYLQSGSHVWLGSSNSYGVIPLTYCTIASFPGEDRANVRITASSGNSDISDRVKFDNISDTMSGASSTIIAGCNVVWFNNCHFSSSSPGAINSAKCCYVTHNIVEALTQGFSAFGGTTLYFGLIRGNTYDGTRARYPGTRTCYTYIGNSANRDTASYALDDATVFRTAIHLNGLPTASNVIFAYNTFYRVRSIGNGTFFIYDNGTLAPESDEHGCAIVQNIIETVDNASSSPLAVISGDGCLGSPINHLISWHNVWVGQRQSWGYNDSGSDAKYKPNWQSKNNLCDAHGSKTDWFTGYGPATGSRIGNYNIMNGVGHKGNWWGHFGQLGSQFELEFAGLNCAVPAINAYPINYIQYVDRQSANGVTNGTGSGNYAISASSPLVPLGNDKYDWVLPYDIAGNVRTSDTNFPGSFIYGQSSSPAFTYISNLYHGFFIGSF